MWVGCYAPPYFKALYYNKNERLVKTKQPIQTPDWWFFGWFRSDKRLGWFVRIFYCVSVP